jgi:heat shock protein HslJ
VFVSPVRYAVVARLREFCFTLRFTFRFAFKFDGARGEGRCNRFASTIAPISLAAGTLSVAKI